MGSLQFHGLEIGETAEAGQVVHDVDLGTLLSLGVEAIPNYSVPIRLLCGSGLHAAQWLPAAGTGLRACMDVHCSSSFYETLCVACVRI